MLYYDIIDVSERIDVNKTSVWNTSSRISDTLRGEFEPLVNQSSDYVE